MGGNWETPMVGYYWSSVGFFNLVRRYRHPGHFWGKVLSGEPTSGDAIPIISWPAAMDMFPPHHAAQVRRAAVEKRANIMLVEVDRRITVVLYGPNCVLKSPVGFAPSRGTIIAIAILPGNEHPDRL